MTRRLDDTKVGEYKNNWFFELIQLLISIIGCVAVFIIPIKYNETIDEAKNSVTSDGVSIVEYLMNPSEGYVKILSIVLLVFFGLLLLNIFLTLAISRINKSVYVKISKVMEFILSIVCLSMLGYYMYTLLGNSGFTLNKLNESMFINISAYMIIVQMALINSMFVYFNSKKVSIYD